MHQLTDEQLAIITTWANKTPDVQAVFLSGDRARGTAGPDSNVELALAIIGQDSLIRLATFIIRRRAWRAELEPTLGVPVKLERTRSEATPADYVELWRRA
jgi:hypothetical protein